MNTFVKYVVPSGSGFIFGVALFSLSHSITPLLIVLLFFISYLSACIFTGNFFYQPFLFFSLITVFIWVGGIYTEISMEDLPNEPEREVRGEKVVIVSEEKISNNLSRYTARTEGGSNLLLTTFTYPKLPYGTEIEISGEILKPPVFDDFDYRTYLKKEGINSIIYLPEIKITNSPDPSLKGSIISFKRSMRSALRASLPYPHDTIAGAMILGDGDRVSEDIGTLFASTGIRHVIAISGLHIAIIAGLLMVLFSSFLKLGRGPTFWATSFFVILFVFFVGAPSSAIRAGIMALIFLLAFKIGKPYSAPRALLLTAVVMLIMNPMLLIYDIGFQLSFLAVLGIFYITPHIEKILGRERSFLENTDSGSKKKGLISLFSVSIGAHLATLPLVSYNFGIISLSAPLMNIVAVPLLPVIIVSGFSGAILGSFSEVLGRILAFPAFLGLEIILRTAKIIDKFLLSSMEIKISLIWMLFFYAILFLVFLWLYLKKTSLTETTLPLSYSLQRKNRPF